MATYGDMRDAYSSIYEDTTDDVGTALEFLLESGIIDEEELKLLEMRKQDKVAGVKSGGSDDPLVRAISKRKKEMAGGQQKKHIPGDKKRHTEVRKGPSPLQMQQVKKARQKSYKDMLHSPRD